MSLSRSAVATANATLWKMHPELKGRQLTLEPNDAPLRKEWLDAYNAADPVALQHKPVSIPVQPCQVVGPSAPKIPALLSPDSVLTSTNAKQAIGQALNQYAPELGKYISDKIEESAVDLLWNLARDMGSWTIRDLYDFISGYVLAKGYRDGINASSSSKLGDAGKGIVIDIFLDIAGEMAASLARRNGASEAVADFDKYMTISVGRGLIGGPQKQAIAAATDIFKSGVGLTVDTVNHFNEKMEMASQIADSAEAVGMRHAAAGDHKAAAKYYEISSHERQAIADMYKEHPAIADLSEIPRTISSWLPKF